jgi:hypothetical protein
MLHQAVNAHVRRPEAAGSNGGVAAALLLMMLLPAAVHAKKRVAPLIGNQGYASEVGQLGNPHNDIALLGGALKRLGFEVTTVRAAGLACSRATVRRGD